MRLAVSPRLGIPRLRTDLSIWETSPFSRPCVRFDPVLAILTGGSTRHASHRQPSSSAFAIAGALRLKGN